MEERIPKIGVFDSGIGGLTVLRECFFLLPDAEYYYLGDNARAPYGNRSEEEITSFVMEGLSLFERLRVDVAVLACNTATAVCLGRARREFSFPIVGTEPAVRLAAKECRNAVVLATVRTAESMRLKGLIASCPSCSFTVLPCPSLAGEIERTLTEGGRAEIGKLVPKADILGEKADGVVLGCTHYVFFRDEIASLYGCKAYDGNLGVAKSVLGRLKVGRAVHHFPPQNQNICFEIKMKELAKNRVFFVGNSQDTNKKVFFSNICFRCS